MQRKIHSSCSCLFLGRSMCFVSCALSIFLSGCSAGIPSGKVCFQNHCYQVDVAETSDERERGLMYREKLDPGQGMLFVFEKEAVYPFWMKNMTFAIDILWIDANKKIVHVASRIPPCREDPCPVYSPHVEARYVLEIPAGDSIRYGMRLGRVVTFSQP